MIYNEFIFNFIEKKKSQKNVQFRGKTISADKIKNIFEKNLEKTIHLKRPL